MLAQKKPKELAEKVSMPMIINQDSQMKNKTVHMYDAHQTNTKQPL